MKAVVAAFNQEKALVGAFSVITNLRMELFEALDSARLSMIVSPAHATTATHHTATLHHRHPQSSAALTQSTPLQYTTTTSSVMFSVNLFQIFIYSGWFDCQYPLTREAEWWLVLGLAPRRAAGVDAAADGAGWSAAAAPSATASWRRSCGCRAPPWVRQHPAPH